MCCKRNRGLRYSKKKNSMDNFRARDHFHFYLENTVFRIFMFFSVLAIVISALYTVVDLIYNAQKNWIE